jgi:hypothetical protein
LTALAESLESPLARRHLAAALTSEGVIEGAQLGGSTTMVLDQVPVSKLSGDRATAAMDIALHNIRAELAVLVRRESICFGVSIVMGVALAAAILWSALGIKGGSGIDTAKALATLGPTAGGGAMFAYYRHVSNQAKELRRDLIRLSKALAARRETSRRSPAR